MIPIMMLRAGLLAVFASVQGLSVISAGDRTHARAVVGAPGVPPSHSLISPNH